MRFLKFFKKELLHAVHAQESLLMMILFPIALTWLLGMAFSTIGSKVVDLPEMHAPLVSDQPAISDMFIEQAKMLNLHFDAVDLEQARHKFAGGETDTYVVLKDGEISVHRSKHSDLTTGVVEMYTRSFVAYGNLYQYASARGMTDKVVTTDQLQLTGIEGEKEPNSFGYYGITMMTLIVMYGSMQAVSLIANEEQSATILRLKSSPFSMSSVFLVKILMVLVIVLIQVGIILLVNSLAFGVDYGNYLKLFMILIPYAAMANALGIFTFQLIRNESAHNMFLNVIIVILVFLGGGYSKISDGGGVLSTLLQNTPVGMVNLGIMDSIYKGDFSMGLKSMVINGTLAILLTALAYVSYVKRGGVYATRR